MNEFHQDDIEIDLEFVRFLNFQNPLKDESPAVIEELRGGNIGCVMITECKMLSEFQAFYPLSLSLVCRSCMP